MKKILALVMAALLVLSFAACGSSDTNEPEETTAPALPEHVTLDGMFVDTSYVDKDNDQIKLVYIFMTVKSTGKNLSLDSKYAKLGFESTNTYESAFYKGSCKYAPNYYYSSYLEDVVIGTELKLAFTFEVPQAEIAAGKSFTFEDSSFLDKALTLSTDDIVACDSKKAIGEKVDAEGAAEIAKKDEPADEATINRVKEAINGYYFEFYVTIGTKPVKYELEFSAPNNFEIRTYLTGSPMGNPGTYEVTNGYIIITYSTNNHSVEIPYEFNEDGEIVAYCSDAFSVNE